MAKYAFPRNVRVGTLVGLLRQQQSISTTLSTKIVQQPTTLIVVSHGAACNPLLGSLLHIPILSVIGLASYCVLSALFGSSYQHNISNNNPKQSSATKALKPFRNSKWTLVNRKHKSIENWKVALVKLRKKRRRILKTIVMNLILASRD